MQSSDSLGKEGIAQVRLVGLPSLPGNRAYQIPMEHQLPLRAVFEQMASLLDISSITGDQAGRFLIAVNGTAITQLDGWDTEIRPGDEIVVLLPFSGG